IGTWNTRSLYRTGALKELTKMIAYYNMDILAVQETRWTGSGISETKKYTILHSGNENRHELGVAFIVNNKMKEYILDFKPINERLCMLRIWTQFFNLTLINAHAETEEKNE
ncbi:Craniofacial development protein 2, partial [Harpegnathos saltator]